MASARVRRVRRRVSIFILFGMRVRSRFARWRDRWVAEREWRRESSKYDFSHDDVAAVAAVLETKWDPTGLRLAGVPRRDFILCASELVADIKCGASDARVAARLRDFEEELGLRDSPKEHRAAIAAQLRVAAHHPSR
jgi:hypothetical protein